MAKRKEPVATVPEEMAVETCARLGFKPGDLLVSAEWAFPLRIRSIDPGQYSSIHIERVRRLAGDTWEVVFDHIMVYLPKDVKLYEEAPTP